MFSEKLRIKYEVFDRLLSFCEKYKSESKKTEENPSKIKMRVKRIIKRLKLNLVEFQLNNFEMEHIFFQLIQDEVQMLMFLKIGKRLSKFRMIKYRGKLKDETLDYNSYLNNFNILVT